MEPVEKSHGFQPGLSASPQHSKHARDATQPIESGLSFCLIFTVALYTTLPYKSEVVGPQRKYLSSALLAGTALSISINPTALNSTRCQVSAL